MRISCERTSRQVFLDGVPLDLTAMEYEIMVRLIEAAGTIVTRERLVQDVFGRASTPQDRALDIHVANLRRKLGPHRALLATVRGAGHMLRTPRPL